MTAIGLGNQAAARKRRLYKRVLGVIGRGSLLLIVAAGALFIMLPLLWMVLTSLKTQGETFLMPPWRLPAVPQWQNYATSLKVLPFGRYYVNTVTILVPSVLADVFVNALIAYGFARLRAPGKDILFVLVLSTLMLPSQVTLIPVYILFAKIGWINTFKPLIVPAFFGYAFYIFLLRQFFRTVSRELDDAARIDGCGYLGIFWRILLPLSKPALACVAIFSFMFVYTDFYGPIIFLSSNDKFTAALGLQAFQAVRGATQWHLMMAASVINVIPPMLLFGLAQRYFIQGIVFTGVKG
jgi:ABC-type glycerol-3-phosphate transport system permease component